MSERIGLRQGCSTLALQGGAKVGSLLALIANVLSFVIAIVVGVMFLNPDALKVWATAN